ncbi:MAG TPA: helix-turn-helix domain-containing protein [Thermoplasmata archaeon]
MLKGCGTSFNPTTMTPEQRSKQVSRLLADDYSQKILANTYTMPMSAQRLSKVCQIPIAACYRRIHELEQAGLLGVDREKEVYKGRKVRLYKCRLRSASIKFYNGRFAVRFDTEPDDGNAVIAPPAMMEAPKPAG